MALVLQKDRRIRRRKWHQSETRGEGEEDQKIKRSEEGLGVDLTAHQLLDLLIF